MMESVNETKHCSKKNREYAFAGIANKGFSLYAEENFPLWWNEPILRQLLSIQLKSTIVWERRVAQGNFAIILLADNKKSQLVGRSKINEIRIECLSRCIQNKQNADPWIFLIFETFLRILFQLG